VVVPSYLSSDHFSNHHVIPINHIYVKVFPSTPKYSEQILFMLLLSTWHLAIEVRRNISVDLFKVFSQFVLILYHLKALT